jgi:hypothetical protein
MRHEIPPRGHSGTLAHPSISVGQHIGAPSDPANSKTPIWMFILKNKPGSGKSPGIGKHWPVTFVTFTLVAFVFAGHAPEPPTTPKPCCPFGPCPNWRPARSIRALCSEYHPRMRAVGVLIALVLVLASPAGAATSGLRGMVTKGPITPVCVAGVPCSAPAKNIVLTFTRGTSRRSVRTDATGRYRLALAAGSWRISIAGSRFGFRPRSAVVPVGRVGVENIAIDTGIR